MAGPFLEGFAGELEAYRSLVVGEAGGLAQARLLRVLKLKQLGRSALKIKGETLKAQRGVLAATVRAEQAAALSARTEYTVDAEHIEWPFSGEYWRDELGSYLYDITSSCSVPAHALAQRMMTTLSDDPRQTQGLTMQRALPMPPALRPSHRNERYRSYRVRANRSFSRLKQAKSKQLSDTTEQSILENIENQKMIIDLEDASSPEYPEMIIALADFWDLSETFFRRAEGEELAEALYQAEERKTLTRSKELKSKKLGFMMKQREYQKTIAQYQDVIRRFPNGARKLYESLLPGLSPLRNGTP